MILDNDALAHYGILRKSGRYPYGSGGPESASPKSFLGYVESLRKQGLSEAEVAKGIGISTTELRAAKSIARNEERQADISMAQRLKDKGYSNVKIAERMSVNGRRVNESNVRAWLAPGVKTKTDILKVTAAMLKDQVDKKGYVDVGIGVELLIGVSKEKLATAVAVLKEEGYTLHPIQIDQLGTGKKTILKVLGPPGTTYRDIVTNKDKIHSITEHSTDNGRSFLGIRPPTNVSSKRIGIRYAEDGGADADGVIYVRPGAKDLNLGKSHYAQVRIAVDGSHYLKGMAIVKDDLPEGVDLVFNTNKKRTANKLDAMKELKKNEDGTVDMDNPFGAVIKPGGQRGALNIIYEQGDWDRWSKSLSSQMLSKQKPSLAKTQLDMVYERKKNELDAIKRLTNPAVRKKLLESFADDADSAAVHLKAANMPRQENKVILPVNSLKSNEIYAPTFRNGERVVLVRHPHGGIFEIPELTVNNRHPEAKKLLDGVADAVGINSKVAERLSGADFDGDTVLVIPNNSKQIKTAPALPGLKDFDPKSAYPYYDGMRVMTPQQKGSEMGIISNLITDMTIKGASHTEIVRAVRHSMVVIDAEKHELDYKRSARENGITALKTKYQGKAGGGASTLISQATSRKDVLRRKARSAKEGGPVDRTTGKKVFTPTNESWVDDKGKTVFRTERSTKLAETDDARTLSSGTPIEQVYADHSNKMKALANAGRKEAVNTKLAITSSSAKRVYANEVVSLNAKLQVALRNAPLERHAQLIANTNYAAKLRANPDMDASDKKKIKFMALEEARDRTGAKKQNIEITSAEWNAIQAGAITNNQLNKILNNTDLDKVKELATPRSTIKMTNVKQQRAQAMLSSGYTQAEVADALGVSVTTLKTSLASEEG